MTKPRLHREITLYLNACGWIFVGKTSSKKLANLYLKDLEEEGKTENLKDVLEAVNYVKHSFGY